MPVLDPALDWTIRLVLAGVLGYAAATKIAAWYAFEGFVRNYRLLPEAAVLPVARILPPIDSTKPARPPPKHCGEAPAIHGLSRSPRTH